jgi:hypothetical protein
MCAYVPVVYLCVGVWGVDVECVYSVCCVVSVCRVCVCMSCERVRGVCACVWCEMYQCVPMEGPFPRESQGV